MPEKPQRGAAGRRGVRRARHQVGPGFDPGRRALIGLAASLAVPLLMPAARAVRAAGAGLPEADSPVLRVEHFRMSGDGADWSGALNRALIAARAGRRDLVMPAVPEVLLLASAVEIVPDADGWTPVIHGNGARFRLGNVSAGFRYRGRKDGAPENPLMGGIRDIEIDYAGIGDPASNSGARGVYLSNGGGSLTFERVRGQNMAFGYHIQNWRYADGGSPGGGITTRDCDCRGMPSSDRSAKWYPFADQGDLSVDMPGDVVAPGQIAVIATPDEGITSYGARRAARSLLWANETSRPIRVPAVLSAEALAQSGLSLKGAAAMVNGRMLDAVTWAYWTSGGRRLADCIVPAETGLIDGADHDGGYYGTMLSGTRSYNVKRYRSRNNVRGIAGQNGARNVHLRDVSIARSLSSAILAGYNAPGWRIEDFEIEASSDRWVGEALIHLQLGAGAAVIGRGCIRMSDNQRTGQYAIRIGPNSPDCRIEGPVTITGDCAKAYVVVESAWDQTLTARHRESYANADYREIASIPMTGISLRNITIAASPAKAAAAPTAIAIIQAGDIAIAGLLIENITITSGRHGADLKFITSTIGSHAPAIEDVSIIDFATFHDVHGQRPWRRARVVAAQGMKPFQCLRNVSGLQDRCSRQPVVACWPGGSVLSPS
ncbi:MAG: hypothetical protein N2423_03515 [Novosphingobium sp.]|nr:hypothetical protein [Novosphingobium sp.]